MVTIYKLYEVFFNTGESIVTVSKDKDELNNYGNVNHINDFKIEGFIITVEKIERHGLKERLTPKKVVDRFSDVRGIKGW